MRPSWIQPPDPGMPEPEIVYHSDGITVHRLLYADAQGKSHRVGGPAVCTWGEDGTKGLEGWFYENQRHRENGPAYISFYSDGSRLEQWYHHGYIHRADGPASIEYYTNGQKKKEVWYQDSQQERPDGGPVYVEYYETGEIKSQDWHGDYPPLDPEEPALIIWHQNGQIAKKVWRKMGEISQVNNYDETGKLTITPQLVQSQLTHRV